MHSQPTGTVTITPTSDTPGVATVSPASITFDSSDWNTPKPITVTGVDDSEVNDERTAIISHTITGYGTVTVSDVTVTLTVSGVEAPNIAPTIMSIIADEAVNNPNTLVVSVLATDPDSTSLTYTWSVPLASGSFSNGGIGSSITYIPPSVETSRTITLTITVSDGTASISKTHNVVVNPPLGSVPTFIGNVSVINKIYKEGASIPTLNLPEVTGGDGDITYIFESPNGRIVLDGGDIGGNGTGGEPHTGLIYNEVAGTLTGTPIKAFVERTFRFVAVDSDQSTVAEDTAILIINIAVRLPDVSNPSAYIPTTPQLAELRSTGSRSFIGAGGLSYVHHDGSGSLRISWAPPPPLPEGAPELLGYRAYWYKTADPYPASLNSSSLFDPRFGTYSARNLDNEEYVLTVVAVNSNGESPLPLPRSGGFIDPCSNCEPYDRSITAHSLFFSIPPATNGDKIVNNLQAVSEAPGQISLTWEKADVFAVPAPAFSNRGFSIYVGLNGGPLDIVGFRCEDRTVRDIPYCFSYTLGGLKEGKKYDVSVGSLSDILNQNNETPVEDRAFLTNIPVLAGVDIADTTTVEGEAATFEVSIGGTLEVPVVVDWAVTSGSPTNADTEPSGSVTIPIGDTSATFDVATADNFVDEATNETFAVTISAPTGGLAEGAILRRSTAIGIIVDDDVVGVTVSTDAVTVTEASGTLNTAEYTIVLDTQPSGTVTITPSSDTQNVATVSPATLTFDATNWSTPKPITVTGVDDPLDNDGRTAIISHTVAGYAAVTVSDVTVTLVDNDGVGVTVSTDAVTVTEASGPTNTADYTVVLNTQPTGTVTITPSSDTPNVATVSPSTLTFDASDWNTPKPITVTGVDDSEVNDGRTAIISHTVAGYGTVTVADVTVTLTDNDSAGVTLSIPSTFLTEGSPPANTATYTVVLNTQPSGTVTITPVSDPPGVVTISPATLTFNAVNWRTAKTITVVGIDDDKDNDRSTVVIRHGVTGYGTVTAPDLTIIVVDDDTDGITISTDAVTVTEASGGTNTAEYTVVLDTQPTGIVTITPSSNTPGVATVSPATIDFTSTSWHIPRTITVTGVDDSEVNGGRTSTISHTITGYGTVTVPDVIVTLTDDDVDGVTVSKSSVIVTEAPGTTNTATYTVVLASPPTGTVTITPSSDTQSVATVAPASVTFDSTNWNTPKTITVTGVDDNIDNDGRTAIISHTITGYGSVTISDVAVTLSDDDVVGITLTPDTIVLPSKDETATYTVVLDSQPTASVSVVPTSNGTGVATVVGTPLVFTTLNWNAPKVVTVTSVANGDTTISHTATGGDYATVTATADVTTGVRLVGTGYTQSAFTSYGTTPLASTLKSSPSTDGYRGVNLNVTQLPGKGGISLTLNPTYTNDNSIFAQEMYISLKHGNVISQSIVLKISGTYSPTDVAQVVFGTTGYASGSYTIEVISRYVHKTNGLIHPNFDSIDTQTIVYSGEVDIDPAFAAGATITNKVYKEDTAITEVSLPVVTRGNGVVSYTVSPTLPDGIRFVDDAIPMITGTPTSASLATEYTYTATDADGDTITLAFSITVESLPTSITLSVGPATVGESATASSIILTATLVGGTFPTSKTVAYQSADGTATANTDYTPIVTTNLVIPSGQRSAFTTIQFTALEDEIEEADGETVSITGTLVGDNTFTVTPTTITIEDSFSSLDFGGDDNVTSNDGLILYLVASGVNASALAIFVDGPGTTSEKTDRLTALENRLETDTTLDFGGDNDVTSNDGLILYLVASGVNASALAIFVDGPGTTSEKTDRLSRTPNKN